MYRLDISPEEQQALMEVLESSISEIHSQIIRADRYDFKEFLKNRKKILLNLRESLQHVEPAQQGA
ncbi:MAG: hypothetical protein GX495_08815 [Chloroflexi bacterium]|jgi:hypothetical protein|nr:hypothetical protein [Chloroflexota bacterium]